MRPRGPYRPRIASLGISCAARAFCASAADAYRALDVLPASIDTFRQKCFLPEHPGILPRSLLDLPASTKWFQRSYSPARLNFDYLQEHAGDALVPLELTESDAGESDSVSTFRQFHAPLSLFLEWIRLAEKAPQSTQLYLAQCQLLDLPPALRADFPVPDVVARAGKGDVYDTNVWIGYPPTYTPLHRDPNPNVFGQLAGQKVVRLLAPDKGQALFSKVRSELGKSSDRGAAAFRGDEMMQGQERALLDEMVWGASASPSGFEVHMEAGDGLFIPKGWWHSIKGIGEGVTASVNWWFR
ncbi:hypothetical protein N7468_003254 [Penicillium chermesinum]|uniref:JmjC domain-containing protein n=1 Tax=Penicillium chermesinum TaxID=63820 RepID=A0A9W9P6L8_9EURO|nr:uncharacterized protein N7468_003254 [Penicillium chermesinum]KAJ5238635.1 hypothetical protein N7468_003254 [Penicillium chermesinum]